MALVIFAGQFGASVVAEGIETEPELLALRSVGISRGQGYWLARPQHLPLAGLDYEAVPYLELVQNASALASHVPVGPTGDPASDATIAVVAHGLLSSLASVTSAITLLSETDGRVAIEQHRALCGAIQRQVAHVSGVLSDLVRGLPPETLRALDEIATPSR